MSECHCVIYHPQDHDGRDIAMNMAGSSDRRIAAVGLAMLSPCPWREEEE